MSLYAVTPTVRAPGAAGTSIRSAVTAAAAVWGGRGQKVGPGLRTGRAVSEEAAARVRRATQGPLSTPLFAPPARTAYEPFVTGARQFWRRLPGSSRCREIVARAGEGRGCRRACTNCPVLVSNTLSLVGRMCRASATQPWMENAGLLHVYIHTCTGGLRELCKSTLVLEQWIILKGL